MLAGPLGRIMEFLAASKTCLCELRAGVLREWPSDATERSGWKICV